MRRILWVLGLTAGLLGDVSAQQEPLFTQFMFNKMALNPGYAGSFESPEISAVYRNQWMGLEGAPNTQVISYHQPLLNNRVGIGGNLGRSSIGISRTLTLDANYAYRIALRRGYLGLGLQASIRHLYQNWNDPRLITTDNASTDQAIPDEPLTKILPNLGFGAYYTGTNWYVGLAVPRLLTNNIDFADAGGVLSREVQHVNLMSGITFEFGEDAKDFDFTPQVLLKYVPNAPFDAELNLSVLALQKFHTGLTYRSGGEKGGYGESIGAMVGLQATEKLFFCLSYDIGLTRLRRYNNGSAEATLRYWINPPEGTIVVDPRRPR
jgi:type IX secretion system PorP/SprF family membrane protein